MTAVNHVPSITPVPRFTPEKSTKSSKQQLEKESNYANETEILMLRKMRMMKILF